MLNEMPTLEGVAGRRLPSGHYRISSDDAQRFADALSSTIAPPLAHPLFAFIAAQRGIGISLDDLVGLVGFRMEEGPLLGSLDVCWYHDIVAGVEYDVTGEVLDVQRKNGRSGVFDLLVFRETLSQARLVVSTVTVTFVLPRRGVGA